MRVTEPGMQMVTACCECHYVLDNKNNPVRHFNESEYAAFGQNRNESHGYCTACAKRMQAELMQYKAERTESNTVTLS